MAGPVRFALARATVDVTAPDGGTERFGPGSVRVQDGRAELRTTPRAPIVALDPVEGIEQTGRRAYTLTGGDGTVWAISRKCNCGSR